jgi:hypothetical protein
MAEVVMRVKSPTGWAPTKTIAIPLWDASLLGMQGAQTTPAVQSQC